jgi:hypothetical protein
MDVHFSVRRGGWNKICSPRRADPPFLMVLVIDALQLVLMTLDRSRLVRVYLGKYLWRQDLPQVNLFSTLTHLRLSSLTKPSTW